MSSDMATNVRLLVVVGPTASGKTSLAVRAALALGGEIVGADSVQVYRGFDIGSGKPTQEELQGARHHLLDVVNAAERFSAAAFVQLADRIISEVTSRGQLPIIQGGVWSSGMPSSTMEY